MLMAAAREADAVYAIVAASNSTPHAKARADFVCDGIDDQVELVASIGSDGGFAVEWVPGDYYLSDTVRLRPAENSVIEAEGTYLHYLASTGDAVHILGMLGCRYRFGAIETGSTDAAITVQNPLSVNAAMSIVSFTGLIGHDQKGIGLYLNVSEEGVCTNRFEGTDISGFDTGILLGERPDGKPWKTDTNWFFVNSIRRCNTCISEGHVGIDDNVFRVTLDTSLPGSVGIRTAGYAGRFDVMMSDSCGVGTHAVVLEPRARGNVFEFHPPIDSFNWEDNSSEPSNIMLSTTRPPYMSTDAPKPAGGEDDAQ
jgi:hypothetical protein